jgi:uncharacterized protein DUF6457
MADSLDDWIRSLCAALQLDPDDIDRDGVLELAKVTAHEVARPAAPLSAFVVGLAVGKASGDGTAFTRATAAACTLAHDWQVPLETGSD